MIALSEVANYIRTNKATDDLRKVIRKAIQIYDFAYERDNRIKRFIKIVNAYASGMPVDNIADQFQCSRYTVLHYARMAGLPKRPKHLPKEIRAAVIRDYKKRIPIAVIADHHNVSQAYVSKVATEEKINRQPRSV